MHYFDWTATTPISENALNTYCEISKTIYGNPSSEHNLGRMAATQLENSRKHISEMLHCPSDYVYFTSGGTESNNIIIQSLLNNPVPGTIVTSSIEHSAVLENRNILEKNGWKFKTVSCPGGFLSAEKLLDALDDKTKMVCFMKVNNVTGSVLDTKKLVHAVRDFEKTTGRKIHIHCDAVQALGKIEFYPQEEDLDSAAFSAHKFYGPRGVGILYNRNTSVSSLSKGGGQEKGLRASTENLPGICSMETALSDALNSIKKNYDVASAYREKVKQTLEECGYKVLSPSENFSPCILNFSASPLPSQVYVRMMNDKGFCLSAGSACSSNTKGKAESVLASMNVSPKDRMSAIRISLSHKNTEQEIEDLCNAIKDIKNGK